MSRKASLLFSIFGGVCAACITGCNDQQKISQVAKTSLALSLDSVEATFLSPNAQKIVTRIEPLVRKEKDQRLRIRGLRLISTVMLSKSEPARPEFDSAATILTRAGELALQSGDSVEWALCTVQLFRHGNTARERGFIREAVGEKASLYAALNIIERNNLFDDLSFGYRTLARSMLIDGESIIDIQHYQLLALQHNDSARRPVLRARICSDVASIYLSSFNQLDTAEYFYLRAAEIFKQTDDKLNYARVLNNLASITSDVTKSTRYSHQVLSTLGSGNFPLEESQMNFMFALRLQSMKFYDSALFYLQKSLHILPGLSADKQEEILYREACMAESYACLGEIQKARRLMVLLEKLKGEFLFTYNAIPQLKTRIRIYEKLGNLKRLTETQRKLMKLQDSLSSKELMRSLGKIENSYSLKLKNEELKTLQMKGELQDAAAYKDLRLRVLLTAIIILTTLALLVLRSLSSRQARFNKHLKIQNATIERQKIGLENSIRSLQRTQAYVLNSEKMVMLGHFTAGVAHELNNPLNFVSGGMSIFEEVAENAGSAISQKEHELLRSIRKGIDRIMEIVSSLRVFCNPRSEIGFDSYSDVAECLSASLLVLQSKVKKENVEVISELSRQRVTGHSGQLCQVFIHVLDNAIDAVKDLPKERKRIFIRVRREDEYALVDIQDYGNGIAESTQPNLFSAFFHTKPGSNGMGMGLFSCYAILRAIRGSISFITQLNQGTTFTVRLERPK